MSILSVQDLRKTYSSGTEALNGISLSIEEGEFVALLGPNGAGKTTTINVLIGNTQKSAGTVSVGGHNIDTDAISAKRMMGVVPQEVALDMFFTVNEILTHHSGYYGLDNNQARIDELLETFDLMDKKHTNARALSGGMKRRLLIAKALVHKPKLFILDEPTAGVDIELRRSLYDYLRELHRQGTTIILTTHYLEEAEQLCDRIVVINKGEIVVDDEKYKLLNSFCGPVELKIIPAGDESALLRILSPHSPKQRDGVIVVKTRKQEVAKVLSALEQSGLKYDFHFKEPSLEDVFVHLTS